MTEEKEKKKYTHPMVFRCHCCKTEHRPARKGYSPVQKEWEAHSIELWNLGWQLCQQYDHRGFFTNQYRLTCPACANLPPVQQPSAPPTSNPPAV
jgi:hypothetical protein